MTTDVLALRGYDDVGRADAGGDFAHMVENVTSGNRGDLLLVHRCVCGHKATLDRHVPTAVLPERVRPDPAGRVVPAILDRVVGLGDTPMLRVVAVDKTTGDTAAHNGQLSASALALARSLR